jgi:hypothetical protein
VVFTVIDKHPGVSYKNRWKLWNFRVTITTFPAEIQSGYFPTTSQVFLSQPVLVE